jgi:hypothetical protein
MSDVLCLTAETSGVRILGSARDSRAGFGDSPKRTLALSSRFTSDLRELRVWSEPD